VAGGAGAERGRAARSPAPAVGDGARPFLPGQGFGRGRLAGDPLSEECVACVGAVWDD